MATMREMVDAVHAHPLLAQYQSPLSGTLAVQSFLGSAIRLSREAAPVIGWVPAPERYGASSAYNGITYSVSATGQTKRVIRTRTIPFEIHIHAELVPAGDIDDFATCEELLGRVLYAIHEKSRGNYRFISGRYLGLDGEELLQDRKVYVLQAEIDIPVTEPDSLYSRATITSAPISGGMVFPDGDTVGPSTPPP